MPIYGVYNQNLASDTTTHPIFHGWIIFQENLGGLPTLGSKPDRVDGVDYRS